LNVVIAGGGVAGTACAVALARIGARVTVYEAYEDPAGPVGAFLSLAGSVRAALTGYEERRRTRVGKMARTAAANRDAKVAGPVAARLRDLMMPLFVGRFYEKATAWLYAYDPGTLAGVAEAERVAE
jgi:2-polyprenyl-6-methoxyphenol hydroxylase-like FAD-dependent oxidoreductase